MYIFSIGRLSAIRAVLESSVLILVPLLAENAQPGISLIFKASPPVRCAPKEAQIPCSGNHNASKHKLYAT